jgi:F0F1-type ATP synthase epsilon subunit
LPNYMADKRKLSDEEAIIQAVHKEVGAATMHVKVHAPYKTYFDGEAKSISAENDTGQFDILPEHHNFMTLLNPCEVIIRTGTGEERIKVQQGIMHVKKSEVVVFLDV